MVPTPTPRVDFATFHNVVNNELRHSALVVHHADVEFPNQQPWRGVRTDPADVDDAVAAARTGAETWMLVAQVKRANAVRTWASKLRDYTEEFTRLFTDESGVLVCGSHWESERLMLMGQRKHWPKMKSRWLSRICSLLPISSWMRTWSSWKIEASIRAVFLLGSWHASALDTVCFSSFRSAPPT